MTYFIIHNLSDDEKVSKLFEGNFMEPNNKSRHVPLICPAIHVFSFRFLTKLNIHLNSYLLNLKRLYPQ